MSGLSRSRLAVRLVPLVALGGCAAILTFSSGCSETTAPSTTGDLQPVETEETVPSLSELESELGLTPEETAKIEPMLVEWSRSARSSEVSEDMLLEDSPALAFVGRSAEVVGGQRLAHVMEMVEHAFSNRADVLQPDPGDRQADRRLGIRGLYRDLDLSDAQIEQIRAAVAEARALLSGLCDSYNNGDLTDEELRDARRAVREDLQAAIADILTEEQNAQLEANKKEIMVRRFERMIDNFDTRVDRRVEWLDKLLDLDEVQEAAIAAILSGSLTDLEALLADLESGALTADETREAFRDLSRAVHEEVREELTEAQKEILDALRDMHVPCGGAAGSVR